jgi:hypothetical protein
MPREYVYTDWQADETGESVAPQFLVSVGWQRGCDVQLATVKNGKEDSHDPVDGLYLTLRRNEINSLIRKLRHARDQAYGRDE